MIVLGTPLDRTGLLFDMWEGDIALDWQKLHVPSTECPRISAAFLESERRLLGEAIYSREYLAEFSARPDRHVRSRTPAGGAAARRF